MKKIVAFILLILIIAIGLTGCETNSQSTSSVKISKIQIGEDLFLTPVEADIQGDNLSEDEIDKLARNLLAEASKLYTQIYFSAETLELDTKKHIEKDNYTWSKIKYLDTWDKFKETCESFYSSEFYETIIADYAQYHITEQDGLLYQCNDLVGGGGGLAQLVPTQDKIKVLSKSADEIIISAKIENAIPLGQNDLYEDGYLNYTLVRQNGYWVLKDFYGTEPDLPSSISGYTSMELVRHDPLSEEEFEKVNVTDIELLKEIDKRIIEMIENEENPSKPKTPAQGGTNFWIRCYKDTDMIDEYSIAERSGAKRVDGKFVEYYDTTDSGFRTRLAEIVLPKEE